MKRKETTMEQLMDTLTEKMMDFDCGDPQRIQHFMKVHRFAQLIGHMEQVPPRIQYLVECAALVHDIGIHPAERKYGRCDGKLQEQEGPAYARAMLTELGLAAEDVERICYLVGHHHTYDQVDGMDYQILLEADFLVNIYEDGLSREAANRALERVFKTEAGKKLFRILYDGTQSERNR